MGISVDNQLIWDRLLPSKAEEIFKDTQLHENEFLAQVVSFEVDYPSDDKNPSLQQRVVIGLPRKPFIKKFSLKSQNGGVRLKDQTLMIKWNKLENKILSKRFCDLVNQVVEKAKQANPRIIENFLNSKRVRDLKENVKNYSSTKAELSQLDEIVSQKYNLLHVSPYALDMCDRIASYIASEKLKDINMFPDSQFCATINLPRSTDASTSSIEALNSLFNKYLREHQEILIKILSTEVNCSSFYSDSFEKMSKETFHRFKKILLWCNFEPAITLCMLDESQEIRELAELCKQGTIVSEAKSFQEVSDRAYSLRNDILRTFDDTVKQLAARELVHHDK